MEQQPEQEGIIDQLFGMLEQLILPNWGDLIRWVPWVLVLVLVLFLAFTAWEWRRTLGRNRSRVPRPLPGGAPPPGVHMPGPSRWPFVVPIGAALLLFSFALPPKDGGGNTVGPFNLLLFTLGMLVTLVAIGGWLYDAMREWRATAQPATDAGHGAVALTPGALGARRLGAGAAGAHGLAAEDVAPRYAEPPPGVHMPGPSPWPFFAPIAMAVMLYGVLFSAFLLVGGLILAVIAIAGWYLEAGREYRSTEAVGHAVPRTRDPYEAWPRRLVPVFVIVTVLAFGGALAPLGINWINSLAPAEATPTPLTVPAVPEIAADNAVSFDRSTLIVPAGRDFELIFHNNDEGVPHNVEIAESSARATKFLDGEIINGVASITYQVPALDEGDYYFLCAIHPNMNGTVNVRPETGPAPPPAGGVGGETPAPQASGPAGP
jgi:plastocyanin